MEVLTTVDDPVTDAGQFTWIGYCPAFPQHFVHDADGLAVIGHRVASLDFVFSAGCIDKAKLRRTLRFTDLLYQAGGGNYKVRQFEELEFKRRRTGVEYQYIHVLSLQLYDFHLMGDIGMLR